jgi:hypothetical protein
MFKFLPTGTAEFALNRASCAIHRHFHLSYVSLCSILARLCVSEQYAIVFYARQKVIQVIDCVQMPTVRACPDESVKRTGCIQNRNATTEHQVSDVAIFKIIE